MTAATDSGAIGSIEDPNRLSHYINPTTTYYLELHTSLTMQRRKVSTTTSNGDAHITVMNGSNQSRTKNSKKSSSILPRFFFAIFLLVSFGFFIVVEYKHNSNEYMFGMNKDQNDTSNIRSHPSAEKSSGKQNVASDTTTSAIFPNTHTDGENYHLIFSTDCSSFQHWQSYLMFHSAYTVKQPGHVTRIASGCSDEEGEKAMKWHKEHVEATMGSQFHLHLTPHFSKVKNDRGESVGDYKFFNKPFGLKHWLEHGEGMGYDTNDPTKMKNEDTIVILIDPDMILLRPITGDFSNDRDVIISKRRQKTRKFKVEHGSPFAQTYGLGTQWRTFNLDEIAGENSPAKDVSRDDGGLFYPVGPPYLATARDMHSIAEKWTEFVPRVHKEYPHLLAEMYAFCIAAAHLKLPHQLVDSLMISNSGAGGEGWPFVKDLPAEETCGIAARPDHDKYPVPSVIHYCQRYFIGDKYFFGKRAMDKEFFNCGKPLMVMPPDDVASKYDWGKAPGGEKKDYSSDKSKYESFMVCGVTSAMNRASEFFHKQHCPNEKLEYTFSLAKK